MLCLDLNLPFISLDCNFCYSAVLLLEEEEPQDGEAPTPNAAALVGGICA